MRRAALTLAATAGLLGAAAPATAPAARVPSRVMVEAREFSFVLSRAAVKAGPAIVQLAVRGEDGHDLKIVRRGVRARGVSETRPGETASWRGRLRPGRWKLYCSLPGHESLGMRATLRVRG
jgi:plastocyanin